MEYADLKWPSQGISQVSDHRVSPKIFSDKSPGKFFTFRQSSQNQKKWLESDKICVESDSENMESDSLKMESDFLKMESDSLKLDSEIPTRGGRQADEVRSRRPIGRRG